MDSKDPELNAYRCALYALPGGHQMKETRFILIRDLPCNCSLAFVEARFRRVPAEELQFVHYNASRARVILSDGDALMEYE